MSRTSEQTIRARLPRHPAAELLTLDEAILMCQRIIEIDDGVPDPGNVTDGDSTFLSVSVSSLRALTETALWTLYAIQSTPAQDERRREWSEYYRGVGRWLSAIASALDTASPDWRLSRKIRTISDSQDMDNNEKEDP